MRHAKSIDVSCEARAPCPTLDVAAAGGSTGGPTSQTSILRLGWCAAIAFMTTACLLTTDLSGLTDGAPENAPPPEGDATGADDTSDDRSMLDVAAAADARGDADLQDADAASRCDPTLALGAPVLLPELSSTAADTSLRLSPDELTAYFSSNRGGKWRIYVASRATRNAPFGVPGVLPNISDVNDDDFSPTVTGDGLTIYYEHATILGQGRQILASTRPNASALFPKPVAVDELNTALHEKQPFVVPDGGAVFFTRQATVDGGLSSALFMGTRSSGTGAFLTPVQVDVALGVSARVFSPVWSPGALFFSSDVAGPEGKLQIYERRGAGAPSLLAGLTGAGVEDAPTWLSPDTCVLYMQSDRAGSLDFYVATRPAP